MFLSRVEINQYNRNTIRALSSPQTLHAAVMASFPPSKSAVSKKVLWRVDRIGSAVYILVQSDVKPDFTHIVEQFGWPASEQKWETQDMGKFLASIKKGQMWRFRLRANPVHSVKSSGDDFRGKVFAHVAIEQQKEWLLSKVSKYGFKIISSGDPYNEACIEIKQTDRMRFKRQDNQITINAVTFEGILVVEDREKFINAMMAGIGRAKAYGCGLLTIAGIK